MRLSVCQKEEYFKKELECYQVPIGKWFDLEGAPAPLLVQMEGECRQRFAEIERVAAAAEKVKKRVFEKMRPILLKLTVGAFVFSGVCVGLIAFSALAVLVGAVAGAVFGALLGLLIGNYHAKVKACNRVLPQLQRCFEAELAWLEGKIREIDLRIQENPPERDQLAEFKKQLEEKIRQHRETLAAKTDNEPAWLQRFNTWDQFWAMKAERL